MTRVLIRRSPNFSLIAATALGCATLLGCAGAPHGSYVVLLDNADGTVGKVQVTGPRGVTVLEKKRESTFVATAGGPSFVATEAQIKQDFGAAIAIKPRRPANFVLYFQSGEAKLTPESERELAQVLAEVERREVPDISVVGHTDTAGDAGQNEALGLERARLVSDLLQNPKLNTSNVTVESHGEKNLLIATPDDIAEPRNRRVEITVR